MFGLFGRGLVRGGHAANERRVEVVEYAGHPQAEARTAALVENATRGMRGVSGFVYAGDPGQGGNAFSGYGPRVQDFTGAAGFTGNPIVFRNDPAEFEGSHTESVLTDPARRILAERMRRRR